MSRSIKTATRPEPHIFDPDPDSGTDHKGRRFCRALVSSAQGDRTLRCALREDDSVHVSSEEIAAGLPPVPEEDRTEEILGEH